MTERPRLPYAIGHRMTVEQEFLSLMELKGRTDRRLEHLAALMAPDDARAERSARLPAAGLKLASGALQQGSVG